MIRGMSIYVIPLRALKVRELGIPIPQYLKMRYELSETHKHKNNNLKDFNTKSSTKFTISF